MPGFVRNLQLTTGQRTIQVPGCLIAPIAERPYCRTDATRKLPEQMQRENCLRHAKRLRRKSG